MKTRNDAAYAVVEFVLGIWIFVALGVALMTFSRLSLERRRTLAWAEFGTELQACGLLSDETIQNELPSRARFGRYEGSSAAAFYNLVYTEIASERVVIQKENP